MKAKKVYEFKRTRKQGLSKQTEIGLEFFNRKKIEEWFQKFVPENNYIIEDDLSIYVDDSILIFDNQELEWIPDNMELHGNLIIIRCHNLKRIPENLNIHHNLNFEETNLEVFPNTIKVSDSINLRNTNLKKLPDNLELKSNLNLYNTPIEKLPNNLSVGWELNIVDTNITELPDDLFVGYLIKSNNRDLKYPKSLERKINFI